MKKALFVSILLATIPSFAQVVNSTTGGVSLEVSQQNKEGDMVFFPSGKIGINGNKFTMGTTLLQAPGLFDAKGKSLDVEALNIDIASRFSKIKLGSLYYNLPSQKLGKYSLGAAPINYYFDRKQTLRGFTSSLLGRGLIDLKKIGLLKINGELGLLYGFGDPQKTHTTESISQTSSPSQIVTTTTTTTNLTNTKTKQKGMGLNYELMVGLEKTIKTKKLGESLYVRPEIAYAGHTAKVYDVYLDGSQGALLKNKANHFQFGVTAGYRIPNKSKPVVRVN